jgi:putative chitinase
MTSGKEYEGRADLGNTEHGDGPRYKGRGLLPIKGREMYELCGNELGVDFISDPDLLEEHPHSSRSAAWLWAEFKNMNLLADQRELIRITKRLTGGYYSGLAARVMYHDRAMRALGLDV